MTKPELRAHYKAKRVALTNAEVTYLSGQITGQFFADRRIQAALNVPGATLHTYLPIRRQREVDTWPILRRVWAEWPAVQVLSSVAQPDTRTLVSFEIELGTLLTENRWGILEPVLPVTPIDYVPTLVLVPLLAFDHRGHRVGYGGGYYDRFLAQLPAHTIKVGLSLFPGIDYLLPAEPTDIPLTACIEPEQVIGWIFPL